MAQHPDADEIRLRKIATDASDEAAFTDEFLANGTAVVVVRTEPSESGTQFSLVRPKRSRMLGYVKSAYVTLDPVLEDEDSEDSEGEYSEHSEDEGVFAAPLPATPHCLPPLGATAECCAAAPHPSL